MHRPIIAVRENVGITEDGEIVKNLGIFARTEPHIWVTHDPTYLLNALIATHGDTLRYTFTDSVDPEVPHNMSKVRLSAFGFDRERTGWHKAQHTVWQPTRMFSTPRIAADLIGAGLADLMAFAVDVRDWCKENDLPLRGTLPGIASSLMRDARFWPEARGRAPRATNERVRPHLPGVYQESRARNLVTYKSAISLDQERAYHRAAQQVKVPTSTHIYARGFFNDPDNAPEVWAPRNSELYARTIGQPGLVAVIATSRPPRRGEWRPPVCEQRERCLRYVWTTELGHCEHHGLRVEGIVAAWTSEDADAGIGKYGEWAEAQIKSASPFRRDWLKPTLHSVYGLLGARPRNLLIGRNYGKGTQQFYTIRGYGYEVRETTVPNQAPTTANSAALGTIQAAIRQRTLDLANEYGEDVLHVHADGLHLDATQLAFIPKGWTAAPVSNLQYLDAVSWVSKERDVLPGRDQRARMELRRTLANRHANATTILSARE